MPRSSDCTEGTTTDHGRRRGENLDTLSEFGKPLRGAPLGTRNSELGTRNSELETRNSELETQNSELETQNSELETQNSELRTRNSELGTQNSELGTRNSELGTQNPHCGGDISQPGGAGTKDGRYDTALWQRSLRAAASPERGNAKTSPESARRPRWPRLWLDAARSVRIERALSKRPSLGAPQDRRNVFVVWQRVILHELIWLGSPSGPVAVL